MITAYFEKIQEKLQVVQTQEAEKIASLAQRISICIQHDGIIHLFGCGHSHILSEEVFYRAGGLVPVNPILIEPLMLHEGAVRSSQLERAEGYASEFMCWQDIQPQDVVIVLSTSGKNPVPIDVALHAKEKGAYVASISSFDYVEKETSRHPSGKFLSEVVDLAMNNHSVVGDAVLTDERVAVPFSPSSTVVGSAILNSIMAGAIEHMAERGFEPPIFISGNVDGAGDHNERLIEKYRGRIPLLTKGL
ncbi:SIS domain-containing protein [Rossellomorea sp. SC111]|uniref:SIS domain-containing protein n=1 Tax=Rossellomorea sp. SC111 TaxID=2968985 RepID=UPI00215AF556|nr:SIS domain-containing protein [Rossellomorea sp. SC111]MCR8847563.1 SIS domain-containing protein [Rossellomorea sp. SC111]